MGPSWYWMPDIMENFFQDFETTASDYFELVSLNPQFEMIFSDGNISIPESYQELKALFESLEPGAGKRLDKFMESARFKYQVGMQDFVTKPCHSWLEFVSAKIASSALKLDLLTNFRSYVGKYFTHPKLRTLMEFPVIFLGASPKNIPALYSLMNYGGYALGTWYPMGGFHQLVLGMKAVAEKQGAIFHFNQNVEKINTAEGKTTSFTNKWRVTCVRYGNSFFRLSSHGNLTRRKGKKLYRKVLGRTNFCTFLFDLLLGNKRENS